MALKGRQKAKQNAKDKASGDDKNQANVKDKEKDNDGGGKLLKTWMRTATMCYFGLFVMMLVFQEKLVFVGSSFSEPPSRTLPGDLQMEWLQRPLDGGEEASFRVVSTIPGENPQAVLLFFGGNGEGMDAILWRCKQFQRYNFMVIAPEPPGYGLSPGPMGVNHTLSVAEITARFAQEQAITLGNVPVYAAGSSLGTFSALHLLGTGAVSKALVHAPLTSLVEIAASLYWYLPVRYLLRPSLRFDTAPALAAIKARCPAETADSPSVLVIHGDQDEIVPVTSGREIHASLGVKRSRFLLAEGLKHNNVPLDKHNTYGEEIKNFFNGASSDDLDDFGW